MEKRKGIIKAHPRPKVLPETGILHFNHKGKTLMARCPAFGPGSYIDNIGAMQQSFYHSPALPQISFRPATTSESISITHEHLTYVKKKILDKRWLQLGYHVLTSEGVFVNPPKDAQEDSPIVDENILKSHLNACKKSHGIYLGNNDFGFAPYDSFKRGVQESGEFAESGLARLLEYTDRKIALNLKKISSKENYPGGVRVSEFDASIEPVLRVSALVSLGYLGDRLCVGGGSHGDNGGGDAFGVSPTGEASRTQK